MHCFCTVFATETKTTVFHCLSEGNDCLYHPCRLGRHIYFTVDRAVRMEDARVPLGLCKCILYTFTMMFNTPRTYHDVVWISIHKGQDNRTNIPKRDTDGSDQSSHSTLKPLHQPISPISPPNKHSRAKERGGDEARRGSCTGVLHKGKDKILHTRRRGLFIEL